MAAHAGTASEAAAATARASAKTPSHTTSTILDSLMGVQNKSEMEALVADEMDAKRLSVELAMETVECVRSVCVCDSERQQTIARAILSMLLPRCTQKHMGLLSKSRMGVSAAFGPIVSSLIMDRFLVLRDAPTPTSAPIHAAAAPTTAPIAAASSSAAAAAAAVTVATKRKKKKKKKSSFVSVMGEDGEEGDVVRHDTYEERKEADAQDDEEEDEDASDVDANGDIEGFIDSDEDVGADDDPEVSQRVLAAQEAADEARYFRGLPARAAPVVRRRRADEQTHHETSLAPVRTGAPTLSAEPREQLQPHDDYESDEPTSMVPLQQRRPRHRRRQMISDDDDASEPQPAQAQSGSRASAAESVAALSERAGNAAMERIDALVRRLEQQEATSSRQGLVIKAQEEALVAQAAKIVALEAAVAVQEVHMSARKVEIAAHERRLAVHEDDWDRRYAKVAAQLEASELQARHLVVEQARAIDSARLSLERSDLASREVSRMQTQIHEQQAQVETMRESASGHASEQKRSLASAVADQQAAAATHTRVLEQMRNDVASQEQAVQLLRATSSGQSIALQQVCSDLSAQAQQMDTKQAQAMLKYNRELLDMELKLADQHRSHALALSRASSQLVAHEQRLTELNVVAEQSSSELAEQKTQILDLETALQDGNDGEDHREDDDDDDDVRSIGSSAKSAPAPRARAARAVLSSSASAAAAPAADKRVRRQATKFTIV